MQIPWWPASLAVVSALGYAYLFLWVESAPAVYGVLALGVAIAATAKLTGAAAAVQRGAQAWPRLFDASVFAAVFALALLFAEEHFILLLLAKVLLFAVVCLGLNVQFGFAGQVNFAAAAFFGTGAYVAAVLGSSGRLPHLLVLPLAGVVAAGLGAILLWPVLRTRGHYAALVTIAFGILFKNFLEVNDSLGGPQGLKVSGMEIGGYAFNNNIEMGADAEASFYLHYVFLASLLAVLAFVAVRRLERSWLGLGWDLARLDETAAAAFGVDLTRAKILAFLIANFFAGAAGAVYAMMTGFVAPNDFSFGDSLVFVSIVVFGGLGNPWGACLAAALLVVLPEKLQAIQEYRFLLYAVLVIAVLRLRPAGLLPRPPRRFFDA
jgi:ABC-type branched-subunit amino acid transport system permease subunit